MKKTAVVLFNLGGPDGPDAVRPFLFNLFNDAAIIRAPKLIRYLIARLISSRRAPVACGIYAKIGGRSPILPNTQAQADALDQVLNQQNDHQYKSFIAMRYWHPFADETARLVKEYSPDEIVLLPLYPQFSTTTTASSIKNWSKAAASEGLQVPTRTVCCYPTEQGFIAALVTATRAAYQRALPFGKPRLLLSAHGLPEKIVRDGDPYQAQCAQTAQALTEAIAIDGLDSVLCFQSRVGPMKWIGPSAEEEVCRAGQDKVPVIMVPIAFVSDHSETLVEIDMEYRALAQERGAPAFFFVPAVGTSPQFIDGLARLARGENLLCSCAPEFSGCFHATTRKCFAHAV